LNEKAEMKLVLKGAGAAAYLREEPAAADELTGPR